MNFTKVSLTPKVIFFKAKKRKQFLVVWHLSFPYPRWKKLKGLNAPTPGNM